MGELVLERLTLSEVLEHEPHLQKSLGLVPDGIDQRPEPARRCLGRLLAEQNWRGHLAVLSTLFDVRNKPHGAQPLVLEDARVLPGTTFSQDPHRFPGSIDQKVATVRTKNGGA